MSMFITNEFMCLFLRMKFVKSFFTFRKILNICSSGLLLLYVKIMSKKDQAILCICLSIKPKIIHIFIFYYRPILYYRQEHHLATF